MAQQVPTQIRQDALPLVPGIRHFASGNWHVKAGRETEFVARWSAFLAWARAEAPGLQGAMLVKDATDERRFVSMAGWESQEARAAWRALPKFGEMLAACRELCDEFKGGDYDLTATA